MCRYSNCRASLARDHFQKVIQFFFFLYANPSSFVVEGTCTQPYAAVLVMEVMYSISVSTSGSHNLALIHSKKQTQTRCVTYSRNHGRSERNQNLYNLNLNSIPSNADALHVAIIASLFIDPASLFDGGSFTASRSLCWLF